MSGKHAQVFRCAAPLVIIGLLAIFGFTGLSQEAVSDPWASGELLQPADLARAIQSGKAPVLLSVAFPVLYRGKHIVHAINAGPTSKPEGIEALKKAVASLAKDADLVIYCGCCPMVKCPNIRPAYRTLQELGFKHIRVLSLPENLHTDWVSKGYPSEGAESSN
jgi:thiosulfate/3-mercaptopyruvate sulfurtransferase